MKEFYQRHLPHYQPEHGMFFVTFRLDKSLPREAVEKLRLVREQEEKVISSIRDSKQRFNTITQCRREYFDKFNELLDCSNTGPTWLKDNSIAEIVKEALHYREISI